MTKYSTKLAQRNTAYRETIEARRADADAKADEALSAKRTLLERTQYLSEFEASFASDDGRFAIEDYPGAAAAVRAAELRHEATAKAHDRARRVLKDSHLDTHLCERIQTVIETVFHGIPVHVSLDPDVETPPPAERPVIVLTQPEAHTVLKSGEAAGKVLLHLYRPSHQPTGITTRAAQELIDTHGDLTAAITAEFSRESPLLDVIRLNVRTAPPGLAQLSRVEDSALYGLSRLVDAVLRGCFDSPHDSLSVSRDGVLENSRVRWQAGALTGNESLKGSTRTTTIHGKLFLHVLHSQDTEDDVTALLANRLSGRGIFLPGVGQLESLSVHLVDEAKPHGFALVATVVSEITTDDDLTEVAA